MDVGTRYRANAGVRHSSRTGPWARATQPVVCGRPGCGAAPGAAAAHGAAGSWAARGHVRLRPDAGGGHADGGVLPPGARRAAPAPDGDAAELHQLARLVDGQGAPARRAPAAAPRR